MDQSVNKSRTTKRNTALALIVPTSIILAVINLYPFFYALNLSFPRWNMARPARGYEFVGLANYATAFSDPRFLNSVSRTIIFVVFAVSIEFLLGFGIAFVLNTNLKGMDLIRKIVIIPVMVMPIVASLIWFYMFNQRYGVINWALGLIGVPPQA